MISILADANMTGLAELLDCYPEHFEVQWYQGRTPTAAQLAQAEALLIRSVTQVDSALLAQAPRLRWLGTATIGTDHVAADALRERGIPFYSTPGVNAGAVGDYVASVVAAEVMRRGELPNPSGQLRAAIIGAGNTGTAAAARLRAFGYQVECYDPPRYQQGDSTVHRDWQRVLSADVISCHVPLTRTGTHATHHLIDAEALSQLHASALLINASRGPVVAEQALLEQLQKTPELTVALDVWEYEPQLNRELLALVQYATAHIAGHSVAGKVGGALRLMQQLVRDFKLEVELPELASQVAQRLPQAVYQYSVKGEKLSLQTLASALLSIYDVRYDDKLLRGSDLSPQAFDQLRKSYPARAELASLELIDLNSTDLQRWQQVQQFLQVAGR